MKYLILLLVVYLLYRLIRGRPPKPAAERPASPEAVVGCAHCGLHVPLSESLEASGRHYCSEEHRRLGSPADHH